MRVLILSALLAYAAAAPSEAPESPIAPVSSVAPVVKIAPAVPVVIPAVTPTIDPGDVEAVAINAKVIAEDQARALIEKAAEENNEKAIEADSLVKEKTEEAFWAVQDKQWQALDAVNTAEAKLDGAIASNADAIARAAFGGLVIPTYIIPAPIAPAPIAPAPIAPLTPISPITYTQFVNQPAQENKEEKKIVKTAEEEKKTEKHMLEGEKKTEDDKKKEDEKLNQLPLLPIVAPLKLGPWIAPVGPVGPIAPVGPLGPVAPVAYLPQPLLTPVIRTQW